MDRRLFQATSNGDLQFFEKLTDPNTLLQVTIEKNIVLHVAVQFDQLEAARKIVHLNSRLVYEANPKGNTPVHVAARVGSSSMVQLLIELEKERDRLLYPRYCSYAGRHRMNVLHAIVIGTG
nr:isoform 2 of protein accelerated cell death 6 [Quercus suber]